MQENNSTEDLKILRNYAIGVAGFATTVSAILIQALHFPAEPTLLCVISFACLMLLVVFLINKSEQRQKMNLKQHIDSSEKAFNEFRQDLADIKEMLVDNSKATLRIEMNEEMLQHPHNHDTILKMAEKYFITLKGDWYETNRFLDWVEKENIHLPPSLIGLKRD